MQTDPDSFLDWQLRELGFYIDGRKGDFFVVRGLSANTINLLTEAEILAILQERLT